MENQLTIREVEFHPGTIKFDGFKPILKSAQKLADQVNTVEVSEDNIQQSKKLRASINKQIKALNDQRKVIKKQMMAPYETFDAQVRQIEDVVNTANEGINAQVRELEERARETKQSEIKLLFGQHAAQFKGFPLTGDDFVRDQPKVLNATVSMKKVEEQMVDWIQARQSDITAINAMNMDDSVMANYLSNGFNMSAAVNQWKQDQELLQQVHERMHSTTSDKEDTFTVATVLKIYGADEIEMVKSFMRQHKIYFENI